MVSALSALSALRAQRRRFLRCGCEFATDIGNEDLAVADLAGLGSLDDRLDDLIDELSSHRHLDARLGAKTRQFINERAAHNRRTMTAIMLTAGCLVIGTSVVISLNITKPLRSLTEGALAMSKGNFDQSIAVTSTDEVGQLAATFNEMAKSIAEVDKMKSDFVTIASHELKTPIQAMLLSISGILEGYSGNIDEEVREDLLVATGGIERLMRLVDNLLNLSRIEARKIDLDISLTRADEIVDKAIAEVNDLACAQGHHIVRDLPVDMPMIRADRARIIQVLINLLSNSVKYSPDGGVIVVRIEKQCR